MSVFSEDKNIYPSVVSEPSIYKTPTIYDTGAGGGGGEYVEILGFYYKVLNINGKKWLDANLKYTRSAWASTGQSTGNSIVNQLAVRSHSNMVIDCPFVGNYYNLVAFRNLLNNELHDTEWHVPSISEFEDLISGVGDVKKLMRQEWWASPGNNELGFNLCASGYQDGNSLNGISSTSYIWLSDNDGTNFKYTSIYGNLPYYTIQNAIFGSHDKGYNIRLCK